MAWTPSRFRFHNTPRGVRVFSALLFCCLGHNLRIVGTLVLIGMAVIGLTMLFYDFWKGLGMMLVGIGGIFIALHLGEIMLKKGHRIQQQCATEPTGFRTRKRSG